jgi:hypothetical protein
MAASRRTSDSRVSTMANTSGDWLICHEVLVAL